MRTPLKRDDARYRALTARLAGLKFASDIARGPELDSIRAEQDSIVAELRALEPARVNRGDSAADLPAEPELKFGRQVLPESWRDQINSEARSWEKELDRRFGTGGDSHNLRVNVRGT